MSRSSINHQKTKDEFQVLFAGIEGYYDLHGDGEFWAISRHSGWTRCFDLFSTVLGKDGTQTRAYVLNIIVHFLLLIGKLCHCLRKRNIQ